MTVLEKFKHLVTGTMGALGSLTQAVASLRAGLAELDREENALLSLPAPADDVAATLEQMILARGREWRARHGLDIVRDASGRIERSLGPARERQPDAVVPPDLPPVLTAVSLDLLAALCPDVLVAGLRRVVAEAEYQSGPPLAARLARLAAIEDEREAVQRRHADLADAAASGGVHVEHLPDEVGRRARKAQARERWERDGRANASYYRQHPDRRPAEPS